MLMPEPDAQGDSDYLVHDVESNSIPKISMLPQARQQPLWVRRDETVEKAVTLMLLHDYSQLLVMQNLRSLKGFISLQTIAVAETRSEQKTRFVRDCICNEVETVNSTTSLLDATQKIMIREFIAVRNEDGTFSGPVTMSDICQQYKELSEAFIRISDIENHLRKLVGSNFTKTELQACLDPGDSGRKLDDISNLNFGEYIRVIETENNWIKLGLTLDRKSVLERLHDVRRIRNDVMHFRAGRLPEGDMDILRSTGKFLATLQS